MKVVIIGGVAGGATAAARLRRLNEEAEIVVLERGGYVSYANCGLPYYIGGVIRERAKLLLQTPESFKRRFNVDVRVKNEAVEILRDQKQVRVRRTEDGSEYSESYDKLIYSPGARALRPHFIQEDARIFTLRTVEDTFAIDDHIKASGAKSAVVVGGGFIGLEAAENLVERGIKVTLVQLEDQVMLPFDYDMACILHSKLREKGIDLRLSGKVTSLRGEGSGVVAEIENKGSVRADIALVAVGVAPETELAEKAGLALGVRGAVLVDAHMRTSDPDIYAVGDAVQVKNYVTGKDSLVPLAGPANKQGRIAADNIAGVASVYKGAQGSSVMKLFELTAASTGLSERAAREAGYAADSALLFSPDHATYYPGAKNMTLKVVFDRTDGRILGAQAVGFGGTEKRIDVLATAIRAGFTAEDLTELDLCYAPPYSSAKDPVNMAGYVIGNILNGVVCQHTWKDVEKLAKDENALFLDVQTRGEYEAAHLAGAVNIPVDELRARMGELDKSKTVYVNCYSGLRSYIACRMLSANGYRCSNLAGGIRFYKVVAEGGVYDEASRHLCGMKNQ
ncbi:MAG TPA: FAD-dependent oxidoreductase [Candidatus Borkfalkia avistercoris]|uniref:FAD-dependent oxidoreductase n=1 Tax=Candidatus Borkfalkia avistercoris TaxID=2838504 RepID=A0A9D2CYJ8_9FIRM|nr:FAD-dependent oxidoreductase [Candidatus Borkfalkia avistercoris]